jgi:LPS-assembly protein
MDRVWSCAPAVAVLVILTAALVPSVARSQSGTTAQPVLLSADSLEHDESLATTRATGNVELSSGDRILRADSLTYNERTDVVSASGNVAILEPSGEVLFSEYVELSDQLKNGFLTGIRVLFEDQSRLVALDAQRSDGNRTRMNKAVFSACQLCPLDRDRPPLWQIKAVRVIHNQSARRVDYQDAFLEFIGVPVAYTPYFSHPDPTVDRKSGFLVPTYGSTSSLGATLQTPYYFNIAPHRDATFAPMFTSKEGVVLGGEYRERTHTGRFALEGSGTYVDQRDANNERTGREVFRGYGKVSGDFEIDPTWHWGFVGERTTDDTYLRRYGFSSENTLTSNLFIEGFRGRSYASANGYAFQGLRENDAPGETPLILPELSYSFLGDPGTLGQRWGLDANLLSLSRSGGTDSRRFSVGGEWRLPYYAPAGDVYTLTTSRRGDLYHVDEVSNPANPATFQDGVVGRILPRVALDWYYPFVRSQGSIRQIIAPVASAVVAPYGGNPGKIPNEDSESFEFDDTNLFSHNRFPGIDRWEGGPRFNYGVRAGVYGSKGGYTSLLVGQSLRYKTDDTFADKTGLEDKRSDYVGRLNVSPSSYFDYLHRVRLDRDSLAIRRNEFDISMGPKWLRFNAGYLALSRELTTDELGSREEFRSSASLKFADYWTVSAYNRRDLVTDDTISTEFLVGYQDECIEVGTGVSRSFTSDRDVRPSTSFSIRIKLKHLG